MLKKLLFTSALLATFVNANAQSASAPFGITGTITPGACSVALTGGSINFGTVSAAAAKSLRQYAGTYEFPPVNVPISITCGAPTKVEASFIDNKASSLNPLDGNDVIRYGMSDGAGTQAIGSYQIEFNNTTIDGLPVGQFLSAPNGSTAWVSTTTSTNGLPASFPSPGHTTGFAKTAGATTPDSFTTLTGSMLFKFWINANYINNATTAITPTGSGTLTLVYL